VFIAASAMSTPAMFRVFRRALQFKQRERADVGTVLDRQRPKHIAPHGSRRILQGLSVGNVHTGGRGLKL
jgi:hypothetical protein